MGEFGATALISRPEYPTIPLMICRLISEPGGMKFGQALALSTILMIITAAGMLVIERFRIADISKFVLTGGLFFVTLAVCLGGPVSARTGALRTPVEIRLILLEELFFFVPDLFAGAGL